MSERLWITIHASKLLRAEVEPVFAVPVWDGWQPHQVLKMYLNEYCDGCRIVNDATEQFAAPDELVALVESDQRPRTLFRVSDGTGAEPFFVKLSRPVGQQAQKLADKWDSHWGWAHAAHTGNRAAFDTSSARKEAKRRERAFMWMNVRKTIAYIFGATLVSYVARTVFRKKHH